jgi:hypothetical protein
MIPYVYYFHTSIRSTNATKGKQAEHEQTTQKRSFCEFLRQGLTMLLRMASTL